MARHDVESEVTGKRLESAQEVGDSALLAMSS